MVLWVMSLAILLVGIDATAVNIILVSIQREMHSGLPELQWILNAYLLTLAGLMVTGGRLGDTLGRKRVFVVGVLIFSLSSLLGSLAPSVSWIIASRVLQGIGGALFSPATYVLATQSVDQKKRGSVIGILAGVAGLSMALGPMIGGYLVQTFGWRAVFWFNVPLGFLVIIGVRLFLKEPDEKKKENIDYLGAILLCAALSSLVYSIQKGNVWGWESNNLIVGLSLSLICWITLALWQKRAAFPIIDLGLVKNHAYLGIVGSRFFLAGTLVVVLFVMALYFQHVLGWAVIKCSLMFLPLTLSFGTMSALGGRIIDRFGPRLPACFGLFLNAVGFACLSQINLESSQWFLGGSFLLIGLGQGIAVPSLGTGMFSVVSHEKMGVASGIFAMVALIGGTFSVAFVGLLLGHFGDLKLLEELHTQGFLLDSNQQQLLEGFLTSVRSSHQVLNGFTETSSRIILHITDTVYAQMLATGMFCCCIMSVISLFIALRYLKPIETNQADTSKQEKISH